MIKISGKKDYLVALESVAMTDIVLNMFIFFFISFSLIYTFSPSKISKIDVKLPKASSAMAIKGSETSVLAITRDGEYFLNGQKVAGSDLTEELKSKLKENPSLGLLLEVDGDARFENIALALDAMNALGIQRTSIAVTKLSPAGQNRQIRAS